MPLFKEDKKDLDENQIESQQLYEAIKNRLGEKGKKKPKKFTWKVFASLLATLSPPGLGDSYRVKRMKELQEGAKPQEKDYIDISLDVERGLYKGTEDISFNIGDFATMGIDAVAGTNLNEKLTEKFEENKIESSETFLGKATQILTNYGVAGGAAFKIMNRLRKVAPIKKAKAAMRLKGGRKFSTIASRAGYMAGAFGATDFLASRPDTPTLYTTPESLEGLDGRERAAATFRNRLRFGAEGASVGAGFTLLGKPVALGFKYGIFKPTAKVASLGLKGVDKVVVQPASYLLSKDKIVIPTISKKLQKASAFTLEKVIARGALGLRTGRMYLKDELPPFKQWRMFSVTQDAQPLKRDLKKLDNVLSWFRSLGTKSPDQYRMTTAARQEIKARSRTIEKYLEDIEMRAYNMAKGFKKLYDTKTTSPASKDVYLDQVLSYLKKELPLDKLPKQLQNPAKGLDKELVQLKAKFADLLPAGELKQYMLDNVQNYMRKSFAVFTNPSYQPPKEVTAGAVKFLEGLIAKNENMRLAALRVSGNLTPEQKINNYANVLVKKLLRDGKVDGDDPLEILQRIAKRDLYDEKLIRTGEELPTAIKRLLGEENNLRSSVLLTSSHAITNSVNKRLADRLAAVGRKEGWLFRTADDAKAAGILTPSRVVPPRSLGLLQTRLMGQFADPQVAKAIRGTPGDLDAWIQNKAYRALLQFKVATQFGKTVLSPATQVRNVTSASLFPLANGQIGGRASVTNAFKIVMDDIFGAGKEVNTDALIKSIERKIKLGVIDENVVASELGAVLKDIKKGSINTLDNLYNKLANGKFTIPTQMHGKFTGGIDVGLKEATRIYAGGDNLWKWYGHEYAKSQLKPVLRSIDDVADWYKQITGTTFRRRDLITNQVKSVDDAVEEAAAWMIRNTYPTYSKVPEAIKAIRKLPFGNFVSFPAEMLRTSLNIVGIAAREISSNNELIRQMGYRRMMGASFVMVGSGKAASEIASFVTGTPIEDLKKWKRSFAAPWNKDAVIIPMNKWIDGKGKAINFSYFSPYEVVQRPIESFMAELKEGPMTEQRIMDRTLELLGSFMIPLVTPFISESIALERVFDTLPAGYLGGGRGGVTDTGSKVYSITDAPMTKIAKSFAHILAGVEPGITRTGGKIIQGAQGELTPSGVPISLQDEMLALFSGIRIINVDVPRSYSYKLAEYGREKKAVTAAEDFYSTKDIFNRGGKVLADEFRAIQDEALRIQQGMAITIEDALALGVSPRELRKINKRRLSNKEFGKLRRKKFTPVPYSVTLMKKRYDTVKKAYPNEKVDRSFVFPIKELRKVIREYRNKDLTMPKEKPEIEEEIIDQTSEVVTPKTNRLAALSKQPIQTPPLPRTPTPKVGIAGISQQKNPITGLTRTETALLSPGEQEIARRT